MAWKIASSELKDGVVTVIATRKVGLDTHTFTKKCREADYSEDWLKNVLKQIDKTGKKEGTAKVSPAKGLIGKVFNETSGEFEKE